MSRDEVHGDEGWGYRTCVWAPVEKATGGKWPFWSKILDLRTGDTVVHLRGVGKQAAFEGYSITAEDGYETASRPPQPGQWDFSKRFYRADVTDFSPFDRPILLTEVFAGRRAALDAYFDGNKQKTKRRNIFFVRQSGQLQCLNGAYLSEIDEELFSALFDFAPSPSNSALPVVSVKTGQQLALVHRRLGQAAFSKEVRELYGNACCFPSCQITDGRFLVASHIARWTDNKMIRGELGNGLCLCLMHDKAFEVGIFTLDNDFRVLVKPDVRNSSSNLSVLLAGGHGQKIKLSSIVPAGSAIAQHWQRIKCDPALWR